MTRDTATTIARLYIVQQLRLTPATFEILRCPENELRSKFLEFTTEEGDTIEVCDGNIVTHSVTFRKVPLEEVFK